MSEYANGELTEILVTHGHNMENANRCIERHAAIVKALEDLREQNDGN